MLSHNWFKNINEDIDIFDEQEKQLILKDFTYIMQKNKISHKVDSRPEDVNTEFTEQSISAS